MKTSILFLFLLPTLTFAQPAARYFPFALSYSFQRVQDGNLSPVTYAGGGVALQSGFHKTKNRHLSRIDVGLLYNNLGNRSGADFPPGFGRAEAFGGWIRYKYLREIDLAGPWQFFLGGTFASVTHLRLAFQNDNSAASFEHFTSIAPTAMLRRELSLFAKSYSFESSISLPLLALVLRPTYTGAFNFVNPDSEFIGEAIQQDGLAGWDRYFALSWQSALHIPIGTQNGLRLSYGWHYAQYNGVQRLKRATHLLAVGFLWGF